MLSGAAIWNKRVSKAKRLAMSPAGGIDGMDQSLGAAVEVLGGFPPFAHRVVPQRAVAGHEVEGRLPELVAEFLDSIGQLAEAWVGNVAADASQEREARSFNGRLDPGLDQGEGLERVTRDEAFVTELDEPVGDMSRIEAEVLWTEFLAPAPITDGGGNEDSPAADGVEEGGGCGVWIHDDVWLFVSWWL
jgi:hypothetical protein